MNTLTLHDNVVRDYEALAELREPDPDLRAAHGITWQSEAVTVLDSYRSNRADAIAAHVAGTDERRQAAAAHANDDYQTARAAHDAAIQQGRRDHEAWIAKGGR